MSEHDELRSALAEVLSVLEAMSRHETDQINSWIFQICRHIYCMRIKPADKGLCHHWDVELIAFRNSVAKHLRNSMLHKVQAQFEKAKPAALEKAYSHLKMPVPRELDPAILELSFDDALHRDFFKELFP